MGHLLRCLSSFSDVFTLVYLHVSDFIFTVCVCFCVFHLYSLLLSGSPHFGGEASHGRRGLRLVRFMLNSVSISWLLPSLQQKSAERNTSPQKSSSFDRHSVQSFIPRPGATEHCQQTFHWNHIKPLLFPRFLCSASHSFHLPLTLHLTCSLHSASSLNMLLPTFLFFLTSSSPWGFSLSVAGVFSSFCKPLRLVLPPRTWQQSGNLLSCYCLFHPPKLACGQVVVGSQDERQD